LCASPVDPLEVDIPAGAVRALRRQAEAIRQRAAPGVTVLDRSPPVRILESKAAHLCRIARDLDLIADEIEAEGSR
jgi:hypothetical protein